MDRPSPSPAIPPARLTRGAAEILAPALPALVVVAVLLEWSASDGGFPVTRWYPGAIGLLAVLVALVLGTRPRPADLARPLQVALLAMLLYTAWSYASIIWADVPGVAWDGANRTLLYLVILALMALSSLDAARAAIVVCAWTLGVAALAVSVLVNPVGTASGPVRFAALIEYPNAQACLWFMAVWPALLLAGSRPLHPVLRGLLGGSVVVLVDVALLSDSRGSLIAGGICLAVMLAVFGDRVRTLLTLVPVGAGLALTAPRVIDVANGLRGPSTAIDQLRTVSEAPLAAAALVAVIVGLAAWAETARPPAPEVELRVRRAIGVIAVVVVMIGAVGALVAVGNPLERISQEWRSFKQPVATPGGRSPLSEGLSGARYDYYRVSLEIIGEHPLLGIGADNFAETYAARGVTSEFPAYTHSLPLRALVHTGAIGALLLALALGAAALAAWRAVRSQAVLTAAVATSAAMVAVQWFVQGAVDWFWEFPALGGAAFAMLGLAGGLATGAPGRPDPPPRTAHTFPRPLRRAAAVALASATLAGATSLVLPWISASEVQRANETWTLAPTAAFRRLDLAADLNPLSARPALTAGTIALRLGRLARARAAFEAALGREPGQSYALLALGAIASERGDRPRALRLLEHARRASPQDTAIVEAIALVRAKQRFDGRTLLDRLADLAEAAPSSLAPDRPGLRR